MHVRVIVGAPVIVEVHLNANATLSVIPTVGTTAAPGIVKGPDHLHGSVLVQVHGHRHGADHDLVYGSDHA